MKIADCPADIFYALDRTEQVTGGKGGKGVGERGVS